MDILIAVAMGLSLAACAGLRAFLPLLAMGVAVRLHVLPVQPFLQWTGTNEALIIFGLAAVIEIVGDKVPGMDHLLDTIHTVARPVAGSLVAMGAFGQLPPAYSVALGIILGAPIAGSFHVGKAGTRVASTAFTAGFGNPILSLAEDAVAIFGVLLSFVAPIVSAIFVIVIGLLVLRWVRQRQIARGKAL